MKEMDVKEWYPEVNAVLMDVAKTVEDIENLSERGFRPVLHNGMVTGWELGK